jgi:hypothetical protein
MCNVEVNQFNTQNDWVCGLLPIVRNSKLLEIEHLENWMCFCPQLRGDKTHFRVS